jgi:hypothetical protein
MVLSIIIASLVAPGLLGSQEAIRQGQAKDKREEHRARRCNLIANCVTSSARSREIDGRPVVLRNGKLWIDSGTEDGSPLGHRYAGYYLPYPDTKYEGLVTTITDAAPIMNWVYVDSNSHEVRYGVRADAQPNRTGPFDCTRQDRRLTFEGWEGWCAVEELSGIWALYFDVDDDGLKSKVAPGTRVLELELSRKEKKFKKETDARQQDQMTTREVDTKQDAPVDRPIVVDSQVQRPGVFGFADDGTKLSEPADGSGSHDVPQEPPMPKTPPPAYSKNEGPEPQEFSLASAGPYQAYVTEEPQEIYVAPTAPQESSATSAQQDGLLPPLLTRQEQEDLAPIPSTRANNDSPSMRPPLRPSQSSQSLVTSSSSRPPLQVTPSPQSNTSPLTWRPPLQFTPSGDKPQPPKLNRNSGNRAMSQAQMFDALDAAKKASEDMLAMVRGRTTASRASNRGSRANSEAGSISVYSDDGRRQSRDERSQSNASQMRPGSSLLGLEEVPQEPSQAEPPLEQNPREETPSPVDPAIFGVSDRSEKKREPATPLGRSKTASTSTTQRKPAVSPTNELATSRRPGSRGVTVPRSPVFSSSSRTPTRASLASTMSSGAAGKQPVMNRTQSTTTRLSRTKSTRPAEPSRVGPGAGSNASLRNQGLVRSRTSTLLRSLDDLVGQEEQEASVPAPLNITRPPSAPSGAGRGGTARRGLPVRGRGNSRVGGGGDAGKKQLSRDK